jgi:hypothetical protein
VERRTSKVGEVRRRAEGEALAVFQLKAKAER